MASKRAIESEARKHNATIDWAEGDTALYADCPNGFKWVASDCHVICVAYDDGTQAPARNALLHDMQQGTEPCNCDDCKWGTYDYY